VNKTLYACFARKEIFLRDRCWLCRIPA